MIRVCVIPSRRDAAAGYFRSGAETTVALAETSWESLAGILSSPTVTRHFNKVIPSPQLRCCDIHPEALREVVREVVRAELHAALKAS